jgi:hypothetical protein
MMEYHNATLKSKNLMNEDDFRVDFGQIPGHLLKEIRDGQFNGRSINTFTNVLTISHSLRKSRGPRIP